MGFVAAWGFEPAEDVEGVEWEYFDTDQVAPEAHPAAQRQAHRLSQDGWERRVIADGKAFTFHSDRARDLWLRRKGYQ
jgi:hypothetical protein